MTPRMPATTPRRTRSETFTREGEWSRLWRISGSSSPPAYSRCATPGAPRVNDSIVTKRAAAGSSTTCSISLETAAMNCSRKSPGRQYASATWATTRWIVASKVRRKQSSLPTAGPTAHDRADEVFDRFSAFRHPGAALEGFEASLCPSLSPTGSPVRSGPRSGSRLSAGGPGRCRRSRRRSPC
jgi:hypothetical protein